MITHEIRMLPVAIENEPPSEKRDRLLPFAIYADENMNGDDCLSALREIVQIDMTVLSGLSRANLDRLGEACECWNMHVLCAGFRAMSDCKELLGD